MGAAFLWGFVGGAALLVGAVLALLLPVSRPLLGLVMAFGAGVLISAVAYDLVLDATEIADGSGRAALGLFAGAAAFFVGDRLIDRMGGERRKNSDGVEGSGLGIVLGAVLDGIPESVVIGLSLIGGGGVSAAFVVAVFLSNLPESIAASTGLRRGGWAPSRILGLWAAIAAVCGLSSLAGYTLFSDASPSSVAFITAFAGGAILTMLADTMMPEAFEKGGKLVGLATTLGFAVAFALTLLD